MEEAARKQQIFVTLVLALLEGKRKTEGKKWFVDEDALSGEQKRYHQHCDGDLMEQCQCEEQKTGLLHSGTNPLF